MVEKGNPFPVGAVALAVMELAKLAIIVKNSYTRAAQAAGMTEEEKDKLYGEEEAKMLANDPDSFPKPWIGGEGGSFG